MAFLSPKISLRIFRTLFKHEYRTFLVASQKSRISSAENSPLSIGLSKSTTSLLKTVKLNGCSWWILAYSTHCAKARFLASKPRCALCWRMRASAGPDQRPHQQYFSIFSVSISWSNNTLSRWRCSCAATCALCSALKASRSFTTPRRLVLFFFSRPYHIVWPVVGISWKRNNCKVQIYFMGHVPNVPGLNTTSVMFYLQRYSTSTDKFVVVTTSRSCYCDFFG